MNVELLRMMVSQGNRAQARRWLQDVERSALRDARYVVDTTPVEERAVLAPIVSIDDPERRSLLCKVEVGPGAPSPALSPRAREATERALAAAWALSGGRGPQPELAVRVPLAEALELEIDGDSIELASLLVAAGELGRMGPTQTIVASGSFEHTLDYLEEKTRITAGAGSAAAFVVATRGLPTGELAATRVDDPEDAARFVFGHVPWHESAEVLRVHAFCGGRQAPPGAWEGREVISVQLEDRLAPDLLAGAAERIQAAFGAAPRVELSLGVPVAFAAYLGRALKNLRRHQLRFVHDGRPWWTNRTRCRTPPPRATGGERRILLTTDPNARRPEDWTVLPLAPQLRPEDLTPILERFLEEVSGASRVDVALLGPWPLALALAQQLANRQPFTFHHRNPERDVYEAWVPG